MNERIKELASQAHEYARNYVVDCKTYGHYMDHNELEQQFERKFAELLIRECANIARAADDVNVFGAGTGYEIAYDIEQQLGVF